MSFSRAAAILIFAGSALAAHGQKVTLRLNPPVNKPFIYGTTTTIKASGPMSGTTTQSMTVLMKALKNSMGRVTLQSTIEGVKITGTGPTATNAAALEKRMNGQKSKTVVDNQGRPVGADESKMMQRMMQGGLSNTYFPSGAVTVGSKWSNTVDLAKMVPAQGGMKVSGGKMPINMTLKKFETRAGKKVATIEMKMSTTMGITGANPAQSMKMSINSLGTVWIDVATGMPVESSTHALMTSSFGGQQMTQDITSKTKLK